MKAIITPNCIEIEGFRYFVGKASSIGPGAYGNKSKTGPGGSASRLDVFDFLPTPKIEKIALKVTAIEVDVKASTGLGLLANLKVAGLDLKGGIGAAAFTSGELVLAKVSPTDKNEVIRQLNDAPKVKDYLIERGADARVVYDLLVLVAGSVHAEFKAGVGGKAVFALDGGTLGLTGAAGSKITGDFKVGPGTVVGYSLADPKWDAVLDRNKKKVEDLRMDEASKL